MFRRENFVALNESIEEYTSLGSGRVKAGLKIGLFYLIKASVKIVKANFLIKNEDKDARNIDDFMCVLELLKDTVFSDAVYQNNKDKLIRLRKPAALPLEADVRKLGTYTLLQIQKIVENVFEFFNLHRYITLRNLICARLTLFNARRGGEPPRLFLSELRDANDSTWITPEQLDSLDDMDKKLAKNTKITYQSGKGNYVC